MSWGLGIGDWGLGIGDWELGIGGDCGLEIELKIVNLINSHITNMATFKKGNNHLHEYFYEYPCK